MTCDKCMRAYPENLIYPLITNDINEDVILQLCPLCALYKLRDFHSLPLFIFQTSFTMRRLVIALDYLDTQTDVTSEEQTRIDNLWQ